MKLSFRANTLFILLIMSGLHLYAQNSISAYYNNYTDELTTRIYSVTKYNSIQFSDDSGRTQTYRPNNNLNLGFGFNYRGLGLNFGFKTGLLGKSDEEYGETTHINFDANMYGRKFVNVAYFEYYKGYYISGNQARFPPGSYESLTTRSDLQFFYMGLSSLYIFNNKRLSYRATFTQDAWQKKSAGSFIMGPFLTATNIWADSNMILDSLDYNDRYNLVSNIISYDLGLHIGYVYNWVIKEHWFFLIQATLGPGYNHMRTNDQDETYYNRSDNLCFRSQGRIGLGYNSEKVYAGIAYVNEDNSVWLNPSSLTYTSGQFRMNVIYRFDVELKLVDKTMDTFHWFFLPKAEE